MDLWCVRAHHGYMNVLFVKFAQKCFRNPLSRLGNRTATRIDVNRDGKDEVRPRTVHEGAEGE